MTSLAQLGLLMMMARRSSRPPVGGVRWMGWGRVAGSVGGVGR